jgi:integrase
MKGSIIERNGSYRLKIPLGKNPATGKYDSYFETFKGTRGEAQKRLRELLTQLDKGIFIKPGKQTIKDYLERWLKEYAWPNLAPKTAEGYEHIIRRHIIPAFGNIQLTQIKPEMIQRYQADKLTNGRLDGKGGLSAKTVNHHHITLHNALESAVKWGLLIRNPVDSVDHPHFQRHEFQVMNEDGVNHFLEMAKQGEYYALFYTALHTAMRRSELLALRWQDVDLLLCQVSVNRSLHHLRDGSLVFRSCKTAKSRRLIDLTPSNAIVLREHYEEQNKLRKSLGLSPLQDDDLVFCQIDGKPLLPDTVTHAWIKLRNRSGFKNIRLHDARHTHASIMLKNGTHPKIVQERLGHSSIQITLDTYSHVAPGLQAAAAVKFDETLKPKENKLNKEQKYTIEN